VRTLVPIRCAHNGVHAEFTREATVGAIDRHDVSRDETRGRSNEVGGRPQRARGSAYAFFQASPLP
jgi:hypothetical protein